MSELEALARNALQSMDEGRLDEWEQTMHPDCLFVGPGVTLRGRAEIRRFVEDFHRAFPDVRHDIETVLVSGDSVILEGRFSGMHTGVFSTPQGDVPPTGRRIDLREAQIVTVRDEKAISMRTYFDRLDMMAQLGLLPMRDRARTESPAS